MKRIAICYREITWDCFPLCLCRLFAGPVRTVYTINLILTRSLRKCYTLVFSWFNETKLIHYLQMFIIAQSKTFCKAFVSLSVGPGFLWLLRVSSVTVMVMFARALGLAYLLSLLSIGEGVTRKSRREDTIDDARFGNFTASLPIDWKKIAYNWHYNLILKA